MDIQLDLDKADWKTWSLFVLKELERLNKDISKIQDDNKKDNNSIYSTISEIETRHNEIISQLRIDVRDLQVKSGIIGGVSGTLMTIALAILQMKGIT